MHEPRSPIFLINHLRRVSLLERQKVLVRFINDPLAVDTASHRTGPSHL